MSDTRYCLCCGEDVPFSTVERNERRESICDFCGFTLDVQKLYDAQEVQSEGYALIAEDSQYTRKIIEGVLIEKKVSAFVNSFENGLALITEYAKLLPTKSPVDIAIIDLNMPVMDGLTAARTMRELEKQHKAHVVPIVFFSAHKADENLRQQMEALKPAFYVNKGSDPDPDKLASRVEYLVGYIIEKFR
jgi:CheY-like chemotaxis protein